MIHLTSFIHFKETNSVEATWCDITSDADGAIVSKVQVKCRSYADVQMQMLRDDALEIGTPIAEYEDLIALVESKIVPCIPTPEELAAIEVARVAALWQSAHDYETAQVSGSAIGLLAIGVIQSKPKCVAVQAWIKSIWSTYYERKGNGSTDFSFTVAGDCPYSVPDLMMELGL